MESVTRNARFLEEVLGEGPLECLRATVSPTGQSYKALFDTPQGKVVAEVILYSRVSQGVSDVELAEELEQKAMDVVQKRRRARRDEA